MIAPTVSSMQAIIPAVSAMASRICWSSNMMAICGESYSPPDFQFSCSQRIGGVGFRCAS